jgi:hypothetical protein
MSADRTDTSHVLIVNPIHRFCQNGIFCGGDSNEPAAVQAPLTEIDRLSGDTTN